MNLFNFKAFIASLSILYLNPILADWEPDICWMDVDLSSLTDTNYLTLKQKISDELKNSWCSKEKINLLMDLVLIEKPQVCVEIGAFTGSSVLPVAATLAYLKQGKVYAIDGWSNSVVVQHLAENDPNRAWWTTVDMKSVRSSFGALMNSWKVAKYVQELALPSDKAISQINEEIDFLHLDGDYSEIGSMRDVEYYLPKVKEGGYILLSNLFTMINGKQPKLKAFCALLDTCELVIEIENDNAILFKKL